MEIQFASVTSLASTRTYPRRRVSQLYAKHTKNSIKKNPPIPTRYLREMLSLILQENSFQFNGKDNLQTHGTAMGTKMAVAFIKHIYGQNRKRNTQTKHHKTNFLEKIHR